MVVSQVEEFSCSLKQIWKTSVFLSNLEPDNTASAYAFS